MSQMSQRRSARARRIYGWLVRLYPAAHRRKFAQQMLQTFEDHYRDAVETGEEGALGFWLGVTGDTCWSLAREHGAAMKGMLGERIATMKTALAVAAMAVGILLLLGLRIWLYPAVLSAPHGGGSAASSVVGLVALVAIYVLVAGVILRISASRVERSTALRRATWLGALVGVCAVVAIAADTLAGPESAFSLVVWPLVVLAALIGWGLAGLLTTRAGGSWRLGVVAALWSGMVSALVAAAAEVASTLLALPQLAQHELSNPDYLYWGQPDIRSYAIASAFALGMMGLILAPIVAGVVGAIGGWLGRMGGLVAAPEEAAS